MKVQLFSRPGRRAGCLAALILACNSFVAAQSSPDAELQSRIRAATEAQKSDDVAAAATANHRLIAFALAQLAELKLSQGDAAGSADLYRQSIELEDIADSHYGRAVALMAAGQNDDALRETEVVVERDAKSPAGWSLQGKLWLAKKEYQHAADSLTRSLSLQEDWGTTFDAGTALLKLNQTAKAAALFQQLEKGGMNPVRLHVVAGRVYEAAGLYDDAEKEYRRAIALDPKSSHGHYSLGLMYLTRNTWEPSPEARREIESEVRENPSDYHGNFMLGYLLSVEKDYEASDRHLQIAAKAQPDVPDAYLYLGLNAYGRGDNERAQQMLRKAIELTGTDESRNFYQIRRAYFALGRSLILTGHKEDGTQYAEKAKATEAKLLDSNRRKVLDTASDSPDKLKSVIPEQSHLTPEQKAQLAAVEQQLREIIGNAYNNWGISDARTQDYVPALTHFRAAEQWYAQATGLMRNLGMSAFLAGDDTESARALKMAVVQDASDQQAQSVLAMSLFSLKDYAEAAKAFEQSGDVARTDPRLSYQWAYSLAQIHSSKRAAQILDALTAQSLPPEMLVQIGQLYASMGNHEQAEACFRKARQENPASELPR
jgi:tetratricopeptide (TPR) repeat protein